MGVDLAAYRAAIGQFVPRPVKSIVTNMDYLCKAVASVWGCLTRQDGLNSKGALTFIDLLLRAQGIEPNPGPGKKSQQSTPDEQSEENDDVSAPLESSIDPIRAERISQFVASLVPDSKPVHAENSQTDEYACAVAVPDHSSGAIAKSTVVSQVMINYVDKRQFSEKIHVKKMKVENAENVCTGDQTIVHTGQAADNENDVIQKQRKKSPKRILLEENAETMLIQHVKETENLLVTRTEAVTAVVKRLKDYNMVVIAGVTGEGKTTLGREICKQLRDGTLDKDIKSKTPVLMTTPQDWNDVVNDKDDIVVFVDDIFGKTNYQTGLLNGWKPLFDRIMQCLHEKHVCLVATSRTHILKDARRDSGVLIEMVSDHVLSGKKTIDLTDDQKLTRAERLNIYKNHSRQRQIDEGGLSTLPVHSFPPNISLGFAQICKLFFTNDTFFEKGEQFFKKPDRILTEEIERMRLTEPHKYLALVYCFLNDQRVDTKKLNRLKISKEEHENIKSYAEVCGVLQTDNVLTLLKQGLDALDRTYLTKQNTVFTFGHQSIADSVSLVFGKESPEIILEKCSNRVILELLDVSENNQTDMCTLHVPSDCFEHLVKRMYKMIIEGDVFDGITLESFPRFQNQELANCLFEYITTRGDMRAFLRAHIGDHFFSATSLLESCANNVFFLKSLFKFKFDEFIVKESGILFFTRTLQKALKRSLEHNNRASLSFLLANGAFLTEECLDIAICSNDVDLVEFVLPLNIWTESEVSKHIDHETTYHLREMLEEWTSMCKIDILRNRYLKPKTYVSTSDTHLSNMTAKDMSTAVETMDFETLHTIFQYSELKDHHNRLIKSILDKKHKRLSDAIAVKRMGGQIDGTVVQYALHRCDLDMFRFFLFSSNVTEAQLTSMLSEAIHLNKIDHIEVLTKAGGHPSLDDFITKAGTASMGVECVVATIMKSTSWTRAQLDRALDAAVCSGTQATMKVLHEGGARFAEDALVNVSIRQYEPLQIYLIRITGYETTIECVPVTVRYVFSEHEWSKSQVTDAITAALESGSFHTVKFLMKEGGSFCNGALLAAVRNQNETLKRVRFVQESRAWSVDQMSDALHLAMALCRPKVVFHLMCFGAKFNDSSLQHVIQWKVEHHVQIKFLKYILKSRTWSKALLDEAYRSACKSNSLVLLKIAETREPEIPKRDALLKLQKCAELKELTLQMLKDDDMGYDLALILNTKIEEGCIVIVEQLICEFGISCDDDGLSNAMDNTRDYQSYDRLKMVRLVCESKDWSDELLTKALDKAVRLGYSEVVLYLHTNGAKFSGKSLENAMLYKNTGYDPYDLVTYVLNSRHYNQEQMTNALTTSLEIGHYQLMTMFQEKGTQFADKSLQQAIHKGWIPSDRLPAVKFILNARRWDNTEKNEALHRAVKFGDISVIEYLLKNGGGVSPQCLKEILEKKCKPSHRLCIVRLLLSSSGSLSPALLDEASERARQRSEPKLVAYIRKFIK